MLFAVLSGFAAAIVAPWVYRVNGRVARWLFAAVPFALTIYFVASITATASGNVFSVSYDWAPSLGIRLSFLLDGLSLLFAMLISGVGAVGGHLQWYLLGRASSFGSILRVHPDVHGINARAGSGG